MEAEDSEDFAEMAEMISECAAKDEKVVQIHEEGTIEEGGEDGIHCALEGGRGVAQTEWHDEVLVQAKSGAEGGLLNITGGDANLVVSHLQIQFAEHTCTADSVQ